MVRPKDEVRVFRPALILRAVIGVAGLFWLAVLVALMTMRDVPWSTFAAVLVFLGFFGGAIAYYTTQRIVVDARGVTHQGLRFRRTVAFSDIQRVHVFAGIPVTVYSVAARRGQVLFTSFFKGHRELFELIREKAGLES